MRISEVKYTEVLIQTILCGIYSGLAVKVYRHFSLILINASTLELLFY